MSVSFIIFLLFVVIPYFFIVRFPCFCLHPNLLTCQWPADLWRLPTSFYCHIGLKMLTASRFLQFNGCYELFLELHPYKCLSLLDCMFSITHSTWKPRLLMLHSHMYQCYCHVLALMLHTLSPFTFCLDSPFSKPWVGGHLIFQLSEPYEASSCHPFCLVFEILFHDS